MRGGENIVLFLSSLPVPKTNRYIRRKNGKVFKPARVIHWESRALWELKQQYTQDPLNGPLSVEVYLFLPDRRKRDIDNMLKTLWDILEKAHVIENDNLIYETRTVKIKKAKTSGVVVVIKPYRMEEESFKPLEERLNQFKETFGC